jgi:hypothetical protein
MATQVSPNPQRGLTDEMRKRLGELEQARSFSDYNRGEIDVLAHFATSDEDRDRAQRLHDRARKKSVKQEQDQLTDRIRKAVDRAMEDS